MVFFQILRITKKRSACTRVLLEVSSYGTVTPYVAECGVSSSLFGIEYTTTLLRICESGSTLLFCAIITIKEPGRMNME